MKKLFAIFFIVFGLINGNAQAQTLSYIPENPTRALIIIHGYGGNGRHLSWMTNRLKKVFPDMALYYPTAPDRAPTGGHQWFVIPTIGEEIKDKSVYDIMVKDAMRNVSEINNLVEEIHQDHHISYQKIYVSGFSQGGLMALLSVLTNPHKLPIAISFSGVPLLYTPDFTLQMITHKPDILIMQGDRDHVIPKDSLKMTTETLVKAGIEPEVHVIKGMTHQINQEAFQHAIEFME